MTAATGCPATSSVVILDTGGMSGERMARALRRRRVTDVVMPAEIFQTATFDGASDAWDLSVPDGAAITARVLIVCERPEATTGNGQARAPGRAGYLGVATHEFPNRFSVPAPAPGRSATLLHGAQIAHIARIVAAMAAFDATRVQVKAHVQRADDRDLVGGRAPESPLRQWLRTRRAQPNDYEFTRPEDRADEAYRGPAALVGADGTEIAVTAHLLAVYEPVENRTVWGGRLTPSAELQATHRIPNQPVMLRTPGHDAVPAVLTERDPWGGSHITGRGAPPYVHDEPGTREIPWPT